MKAGLMYGPNDIRIEEIPEPSIDAGGLLLKVEAVGLCGSDIRNLTTDSCAGKYPHIYGHEVVGTVAQVGALCTKFQPGQRLYVYPGVPCLHCQYCRAGLSNLCANYRTYDQTQGGFAQYMAVPSWGVEGPNIYPIPDDVTFVQAVMSEPLSSVYACQENVQVRLGQTVVIIGAGPIGCLHAEVARMRGASQVIMIELNEQRLQESQAFGVTHMINSQTQDPIQAVHELTDQQGADVVISANPSTKAQTSAVYLVKPNGTLVFFGGVAKKALTQIDTNYLHYHGIWVYGHYGANTLQVKKAFDMVVSHQINAEKFISQTMPLDQLATAIHLMKTGQANKIVLQPWADDTKGKEG